MIYINGLPRDEGASDLEDSARLAGVMKTFNYPCNIDMSRYFNGTKYVRHDQGPCKYDFSRDQAICLVSGLHTVGLYNLVNEKYIDGNDFLSPSVKGHFARCRGEKATLLQALWLWFDVLWGCFIDRRHENNQLLCMLMKAHPVYLKFYCKFSNWREVLVEYWMPWRKEYDLCNHIILRIDWRNHASNS